MDMMESLQVEVGMSSGMQKAAKKELGSYPTDEEVKKKAQDMFLAVVFIKGSNRLPLTQREVVTKVTCAVVCDN